MAPFAADSTSPGVPAVRGENTNGEGVRGMSHSAGHGGVVGTNDNPTPSAGQGVYGESVNGEGVRGVSHAAGHGGVVGTNDNSTPGAGQGVYGESVNGEGVRGVSHAAGHGGVVGTNDNSTPGAGPGLYGESLNGEGVRGVSHSAAHGAVVGTNDNPAGIGIYGKGGRLAGQFIGSIEVTGDVVLTNADCAEEFEVAGLEAADPGTVMVLGKGGSVLPSSSAYDSRVAGIVSGAGSYKPGIVLDKQPGGRNRRPLALMGKVFCKVDASYGPIEVGDLLTTSDTPGHAMKAFDHRKAFGAVIGKALGPITSGQGLVPVLVALR